MKFFVVTLEGTEYTVRPGPKPGQPQHATVSYPDGYATFCSARKATYMATNAVRYNVRMAASAYLEWAKEQSA